MALDATKVQQARELIDQHHSFLIVSHSNPDGDTIGSNMALSLALQRLGKRTVSYCSDAIPLRYQVLSRPFLFEQCADRVFSAGKAEVIATVDTATLALVQGGLFHAGLENIPIINIDHHKDNARFGNLHLVDSACASTTLLLFQFFRQWGWEITPDMATALLLGLMTDTGGFFHANTGSEAYDGAADLLSLGADARTITDRVFHDFDPKRLKLWGRVLSRASINADHVVSSVVLKKDFKETETTPQDLEGVVEYLNMVPEGRYAMLLTEDGKNAYVKGSLRTRLDEVDVSEIAHQFGGGGHKKASGFRIKGKLAERNVWEVVSDEGTKRLSI